ncbi:vesicle transport protein SFT2C [Syngnathoides biaculeatus]|uniref:vesicle transport protein SFT2C n=1 Tax=Syngnathoides biaculeatus TaxID=300417 RepID=UPI002ADDD26A|nr:vesicle transport protein SFT2C [Syngnathoides biaculeatus]
MPVPGLSTAMDHICTDSKQLGEAKVNLRLQTVLDGRSVGNEFHSSRHGTSRSRPPFPVLKRKGVSCQDKQPIAVQPRVSRSQSYRRRGASRLETAWKILPTPRIGVMAELNRQLQEYLSQSRGSKSVSSTAVELGDPEPGPETRSWLGRWSVGGGGGGGGPSSSSSSAESSGGSWPWSAEPDPCLPGVSRRQRLAISGTLAALSALCFCLSALYAPLLLLYARKFALLWSLGSAFAIASAAVLRGPGRMAAGLTSSPGVAVYLCALGGTLYAALGLHSTALTALGAAAQVAAVVGYVASLLPGGSAGIRFVGGVAASAIKRSVAGKGTMPV